MARIKLSITVPAGWLATDTLKVYRGTEGAANLAASTPAGGQLVASQPVGPAAVGEVIKIEIAHQAEDLCAVLPIGVSVQDEAGNEQAVSETAVALRDPPEPPGRPAVAATANSGEALLSWLASPDL